MTREDWRRMYRFAWAVQCFHTLSVLQGIAIFLHFQFGVRYREFYEALIAFGARDETGFVGRELAILDGVLDNVLAGLGFDQYLPDFLDITWPPEEATFLRLSDDLDASFVELERFVRDFLSGKEIDIEELLLHDLIEYQKAIIVTPYAAGMRHLVLAADIPDFVRSCFAGRAGLLTRAAATYEIDCVAGFDGHRGDFAREIVWYGRKGGRYLFSARRVAVTEQAC